MSTKYLKAFFQEKDIPFAEFKIEEDGTVHYLNTDVVIEAVFSAPKNEQQAIAEQLRKIDYTNGDVLPFLRHLAHCLVNTYIQ
jgi:hypothetical protein